MLKYLGVIILVLIFSTGCSQDPSGGDSIIIPVIPVVGYPQITDVTSHEVTSSRVMLSWSYPADFYGDKGVYFNVRCSFSEITLENWDKAEICRVVGGGQPAVAGQRDTIEVMHLKSETEYYFAIRGGEGGQVVTPVSNNCVAHTLEQDHLDFEGRYYLHDILFNSIKQADPSYMVVQGSPSLGLFSKSRAYFVNLIDAFEPVALGSITASHLASHGNYVYTTDRGGDFINPAINFNVYSGPPEAELLGSCPLPLDIRNSELAVGDNWAYLSTNSGIRVIDIRSPESPLLMPADPETLDVPLAGLDLHESVLIAWNSGADASILLADASNPDNFLPLRRHDFAGPINAIAQLDHQLCVLAGDRQLLVFDLDQPSLEEPVASHFFPRSVKHMAAGRNRIFTTSEEFGVEIFTLNGLNEVEKVGSYDISMQGDYLKVVNDHLCIHEGGFYDYVSILLCRIEP